MRSKPAARFRLARKLNALGLVSDSRMEQARRRHGSEDYRLAEGVMRGVLVKAVNEDYAAQLRTVAGAGIGVDFVWGQGDTAAPVPMVERAHALVPGSRLTVVAGSAHLLDAGLSTALNDVLREAVHAAVPTEARRS